MTPLTESFCFLHSYDSLCFHLYFGNLAVNLNQPREGLSSGRKFTINLMLVFNKLDISNTQFPEVATYFSGNRKFKMELNPKGFLVDAK